MAKGTAAALSSDIAVSDSTQVSPPDVGGSAQAPLPAVIASTQTSPFEFFLKIDGVTGDSKDGLFAVDDYSIAATTTPSRIGGGPASTTFSPLTVDIHSTAGLAPLLSAETTNKGFHSVELTGMAYDGKTGAYDLNVYDLTLSDALLGGLQSSPGPNGIETTLTFDPYERIGLTDHALLANGTLGPAQMFSYNLANQTAALSSFLSSTILTSGEQSLTYSSLTQENHFSPSPVLAGHVG